MKATANEAMLQVRLPGELKAGLERSAAARGVSASALVRMLVAERIRLDSKRGL